MKHIEMAIEVLQNEISKLTYDSKYGDLSPEMDEEVTEKSQQLHRAIADIKKQFDI